MDTIESLLAAADAKVAELTDDCSDADAQRIESEHAAIIDRIEALKASDRAPPQSAKDVRGLQNLADRGGIRQLTDAWIDQGLTREEITRRMLDELSRRGDTTGPIITSVGNAMQNARTLDNPNNRRQAIEDALYARMSGKEPEGASREFVGRSIRELSTLVDSAGWLEQRAGGMHTTSDFPVLLTAAGNRVLQDAYLAAQSPLRQLARVRSSADFRPINVLRLSEAPTLEKVNEAGEVTYGSRGEESEAFKIDTFARIFSLSRQAVINDDLGGFADFVTAMSRAAAEREALQLLALFTANSGNGATLKDGIRSSTHLAATRPRSAPESRSTRCRPPAKRSARQRNRWGNADRSDTEVLARRAGEGDRGRTGADGDYGERGCGGRSVCFETHAARRASLGGQFMDGLCRHRTAASRQCRLPRRRARPHARTAPGMDDTGHRVPRRPRFRRGCHRHARRLPQPWGLIGSKVEAN